MKKTAMGYVVSGLLIFGMPVFAEDAPAPATQKLTVELALGTGVEDRELLGSAEAFSVETGRVVAWTRTLGAQEPTEIAYVWSYKGEEQATVRIPIRSSSYRSWSTKNITDMPGAWTVEVRDAENRVLASKTFEVTAAL